MLYCLRNKNDDELRKLLDKIVGERREKEETEEFNNKNEEKTWEVINNFYKNIIWNRYAGDNLLREIKEGMKRGQVNLVKNIIYTYGEKYKQILSKESIKGIMNWALSKGEKTREVRNLLTNFLQIITKSVNSF